MADLPKNETGPNILGLSTSELAALSAQELTQNETAIKMLLHYYRQLNDENSRLKNDINALKTYVDAYEKQKSYSGTGAILLAISNINIGFGVNMLTGSLTGTQTALTLAALWPGVSSLIIGVALIIAGIYFTFWKDCIFRRIRPPIPEPFDY